MSVLDDRVAFLQIMDDINVQSTSSIVSHVVTETDNIVSGRFKERLTPAPCKLLRRHLRIPATEVKTSVDLFTAVDTIGCYTVSRNSINCSSSFYIENGMPCRHV